MPPKILSSSILLSNTQQELKQSVSKLLSFFQDDRGKNLLRSFSALSQCYIDLRSVCLFGSSSSTPSSSPPKKQNKEEEREQEVFSIVYSPAENKFQATKDKIKSLRDRIDSIIAASSSLMNELLTLLNKSKELSHNTYLAAFNVIYNNNNDDEISSKNINKDSVINVHLRLLKDVLETLVNNQLQNRIVTIHVIFNEVKSCVSFSSSRKEERQGECEEIRWKLTLDQLRVYQTALTAEFSALGLAASGTVGSSGQQHPLESIPSLLDRVGILCGKIGGG
jgi:hypothetical protein